MRFLLLSALSIMSFAAFAQPQKVVADKIIAVIGDKIVLQSDIDNTLGDMQRQGIEIPENAHCLTLEQAMGIKTLVLQAEKDSLPISEDDIEVDIDNRIRYFIGAYGGKEELEKIAGKTIFQLKEDMKKGIREQKLAQAMRSSIVEHVRITPKEVKDYFDKIPADSLPYYETELEVGQLIIYPKPDRDAELYAIEQLNDYKKQIESGSRDFKTLASLYSDDPGSKQNGGMYEINRNQKDLDPIWLAKAFSLKEGQISAPFKTQFGYHIIKLESRLGDDAVVRHILKTPQITTHEISIVNDRLDSVRSMLIAGTMEFGTAINKYSNDDQSKFTGGRIMGENGSFLTIDQLDKDIIPTLQSLKVGGYSQPVAYTNPQGKQGMRIIHLISKTEPHRMNLKDDYSKIAEKALTEKQEDELENWFSKHLNSYHIRIDPEYQNCENLKKWTDANKNGVISNY